MPNKTIYISDNDLPIVDTAAELSGGLSAAAVEGMKLLVERKKAHSEGFQEVQVTDYSDASTGAPSRKIFQGRQLAQLDQSFSGTRTVWTSYLTPKDNIVIVRTTLPDTVGVATDAPRRGAGGDNVAASKNKAHSTGLTGKIEEFFLGDLPLNTGKLLGPAQRMTRDMDLEWINNPWKLFDLLSDYSAHDSTDASHSSSTPHRGTTPHDSPGFSGSIPVNSEKDSGRDADRDTDNETTNSDSSSKRNEKLPAPENSAGADRWQASSSLEVFASTEALREAAFRQVDAPGMLGAIPATLITATERGLDSGGVEYLDI